MIKTRDVDGAHDYVRPLKGRQNVQQMAEYPHIGLKASGTGWKWK
jgi:hypothetical protein